MIKFASAAVAVLFAFTAASAAQSATIFTDRALFEAAISGNVTDTFEENGPGGYTDHGSLYTGSAFTIAGGQLYTVDPGFDGIYNWNSGDVLDFEFLNGVITAGAGITALGFDFGNPGFYPGDGTVTINGVNYSLLGQPNFNFWGIVDTAPIGTISWNGGLGIMDNVTTGTALEAAVPEPGTWAMMLVGFGGVGFTMRRRRRSEKRIAQAA